MHNFIAPAIDPEEENGTKASVGSEKVRRPGARYSIGKSKKNGGKKKQPLPSLSVKPEKRGRGEDSSAPGIA